MRLSSAAEAGRALAGAHTVEAAAFVLTPGSWLVRALEGAVERGAAVRVRLADAFPRGGAGRVELNRRTIAELRAHGVDAAFEPASLPALHLKAVVADGTAFLDDRNWPAGGPDTVVSTGDPSDVAAIASAIAGAPCGTNELQTEKARALWAEADAIEHGSGSSVDLATESYGFCAVSKALEARARSGAAVRVMVSRQTYRGGGAQERAALARLARAGASVRLCGGDEKFAIAGDRAWAGSANATWDVSPTLDWGATLSDPADVATLEARFERAWASASPLSA